MRLFLKRSMKYLYGTILLCVLLACSVALGCIGIAAQGTVTVQMSQLEAGHTTIAVTDGISAERLALGLEKGQDFPLLNPDGSYSLWHREYNESGSIVGGYQTNERLPNSKALFIEAAEAPDVDRLAASGILAGHLTNGIGLSSAQEDLSLYDGNIDYITQAFCVLAVRCDAVTDTSHPSEQYTSPTDGNRYTSPAIYSYEAKLTVLGVPAAMEALGIQTGQQLWLEPSSDLYTAEGAPIFEKGRTYLVRGFYTGSYWVSQLGQDGTVTRTKKEIAYLPSFGFVRGEMYSYTYKLPHFDRQQCTIGEAPEYGGNGLYASYQVLPEDSIPRVTEYTGDWQDYLASEKGAVWRETVIPWVQANNNSVQMVLTEDVMTTYNFNTGAATILEGRLITDEEYVAGADVCLVSATLARANGWQPGDTVAVDCYNTGMTAKRSSYYQIQAGQADPKLCHGQSWLRNIALPEDAIGLTKGYTIVGIYTAPEYSAGLQNFLADTMFVPKLSVPNAEQYEQNQVNYANALVLQNGAEDAFEAYMAEQGMGGYFTYCDQNYSAVHSAYTAMAATANRLAMIGICVLALAAAAYHLLFLRRLAPTVRSARLIGVSAARAGRQLAAALLLHTAAAVALGVGMAVALYGTVTETLLGQSFADVPALLLTAAALLAALAVLGGAAALSAARIDLMRSRKKGRRKAKPQYVPPSAAPTGTATSPPRAAPSPTALPTADTVSSAVPAPPPAALSATGNEPEKEGVPMSILTVKNVSYTYESRYQTVYALRGVDASFDEGTMTAIVGSSGSGKTTLLSLLAGLALPTGGAILFDGVSTAEMDRDAWRLQQVSVIYQNYNLFAHLTVLENASYPLYAKGIKRKDAEAVAREKLAAVGLPESKYRSIPARLSGGEQQRVAIARALAAGSRLILADEPTGNLDEENSRNIFEILRQLAHEQGCCVIIVTHDLELADKADTVLKLKDGQVASE